MEHTFQSKEELERKLKSKNFEVFRKKYYFVQNRLHADLSNQKLKLDNINNIESYEIHENKLYARIRENNDSHLYLLGYEKISKGGKRKNKSNRKQKTKKHLRKSKRRTKKTKKRQRK